MQNFILVGRIENAQEIKHKQQLEKAYKAVEEHKLLLAKEEARLARAKERRIVTCRNRKEKSKYWRNLPIPMAKRESDKLTWKSFFNRTWVGINRRTVNGSHPPTKGSYFRKGIRVEFTKEQYREWCKAHQEEIETLQKEALRLNDQKLRASIDRKDPDLHYSFDNIRIIPWAKNSRPTRLKCCPNCGFDLLSIP